MRRVRNVFCLLLGLVAAVLLCGVAFDWNESLGPTWNATPIAWFFESSVMLWFARAFVALLILLILASLASVRPVGSLVRSDGD